MRTVLSVCVLTAALATPGVSGQSSASEAKPTTEPAASSTDAQPKKKSRWQVLKEKATDRVDRTLNNATERTADSMETLGKSADAQVTNRTEAASQKLELKTAATPAKGEKPATPAAKPRE